MSTTAAPVILPSAKRASHNATNGLSTTTHSDASQISAANSASSQSSWSSGTSTVGYASSATSVSQESKYEKTVCDGGRELASAEAEFAKLMNEIPWMRFQITATPDIAWLQEERFKAVFHALTQKTTRATTARVISQVRVEMNKALDLLAASDEHIDTTTVIEGIQKGFMSGACGAVTGAQTLIAGHLPCGCHHTAPAPAPAPAPVVPAPIQAPSKAPPPDLAVAQWIWTQEANKKEPPAGARAFRKSLTLDEVVDSVTIDITCDNYDTLYLNGKLVGSNAVDVDVEWQHARRYTVRFERTKQLVVSVWAMQGTSLGPAALILAGVAWDSQKKDSVPHSFHTDLSWKTQSKGTSETVFLQSLDPEYNDGPWEKVYGYGGFNQSGLLWKGFVKRPSKESRWSKRLTNVEGCVDAPDAPAAKVL